MVGTIANWARSFTSHSGEDLFGIMGEGEEPENGNLGKTHVVRTQFMYENVTMETKR